jgi:hypothetical protein
MQYVFIFKDAMGFECRSQELTLVDLTQRDIVANAECPRLCARLYKSNIMGAV